MSISNNIKYLRQKSGLSQADFAKLLGVSDKAVSTWEKGTREPRMGIIQKLSDMYGVRKGDIIDGVLGEPELPSNILPLPKTKKVPLLGTIACGEPILAEQNIESYVDIEDDIDADFCLRCKGDSMINARIYDGDIVYVRQQPRVEHGQIAVVMVDDEATLKRVFLYPDHITLKPENPSYEPLVYIGERMNDVRILGLAVAFTSLVK